MKSNWEEEKARGFICKRCGRKPPTITYDHSIDSTICIKCGESDSINNAAYETWKDFLYVMVGLFTTLGGGGYLLTRDPLAMSIVLACVGPFLLAHLWTYHNWKRGKMRF